MTYFSDLFCWISVTCTVLIRTLVTHNLQQLYILSCTRCPCRTHKIFFSYCVNVVIFFQLNWFLFFDPRFFFLCSFVLYLCSGVSVVFNLHCISIKPTPNIYKYKYIYIYIYICIFSFVLCHFLVIVSCFMSVLLTVLF